MDGFNTTLNQGGGGSTPAKLAVSITYAALKALRDGGNLVPGTWYRITDYACTTTQQDTLSANHAFDIIVRADDKSHLNENAFAAHHDGGTYFADCKLEAWQLKYSLDNDTDRFAWADTTHGTGVVYWMKDEWENECPYDFKNIQFSRTLTDGAYDAKGTAAYVYTFNAYSGGTNSDATVLATTNNRIKCSNNKIDERRDSSSSNPQKALLNSNVFLNVYSQNGGFTCRSNTICFGSYSNTFGSDVYNVNIGSGVRSVNIGSGVGGVNIGSNVSSVDIGSDVSSVNIGSGSENLNIGSGANGVNIGSSSKNLNIGSGVYNVNIGSNVGYVNIGSNFQNITLLNGVKNCEIREAQGATVKNCLILSGDYMTKGDIQTIEFVPESNVTQVATLDGDNNVVIYVPGAKQ